MSKDITMGVDGTQTDFDAISKVYVNELNGGPVGWVPLDERDVTTKSITEDGTYKASSDGKFGYSKVTVRVPGGAGAEPGSVGCSVVGRRADGNEYVMTVGQDSVITSELIPSEIVIDTLPTKLTYDPGDSMDYTGLVVKLRRGDGEWFTDTTYSDSVVPTSELNLPQSVPDDVHGTAQVTVVWVSRYDSRAMSGTFEIQVS